MDPSSQILHNVHGAHVFCPSRGARHLSLHLAAAPGPVTVLPNPEFIQINIMLVMYAVSREGEGKKLLVLSMNCSLGNYRSVTICQKTYHFNILIKVRNEQQ